MEKEQWKDILGYEGLYQVSNMGRVRSLDTTDSMGRLRKGRLLSLKPNSQGYSHPSLFKNGKQKKYYTHQLVAMMFLGHTPNGTDVVVDHIDGDKLNNKLSNLRLTTHRENISKGFRDKFNKKYTGIYYILSRDKWRAEIKLKGKSMCLGYFNTSNEAYIAYKAALSNINP